MMGSDPEWRKIPAAMVANAQHVPLQQLNWCEPAGYDPRNQPRSAGNSYPAYNGNAAYR